ncbi:hypothetical protein M1N87_02210 [Dehalococcoidia bacterium]|nr:hypothetical protein [Dehalococcoidia bacterium]MCL0088612.1 hypothetical protein [Dehalococcoidia bacterium]
MMPKLKQILRLQTALIVLLIAVMAMGLFLFRENAGLQQEEARLRTELGASEMRLRIVAERLSEIESQIREELALAQDADIGEKEAIIETLRQRLGQALHAADPFPSREEAACVTDQISRQARQRNLVITRWSFSDTFIFVEERSYPAISHSLDVEGEVDSLIGFLQGLIGAPVAPVIQSMDIRPHEEKEGLWRMRLEMVVSFKLLSG